MVARGAGFATLLLCAGDSTRMGRDKALLPLGASTVIEALCARARDAGSSQLVACCSARLEPTLRALDLDAELLVVPEGDRARGPIGSIRAGLSHLELLDCARVLIWPVDHPFVDVSTLRALVSSSSLAAAVQVPQHAERRGHPISIASSEREALLSLTKAPSSTLRDYVRAAEVHDVPVHDEAVHWNCDTLARYQAGLARFVDSEGPSGSGDTED